MEMNEIQHCDCFTGLGKLPNESVDCIVTSRGHSRFNPENTTTNPLSPIAISPHAKRI